MISIERVSATPARLGECPLWDGQNGVLYWIDIDGCRIHRFDPATGVEDHRDLGGRPGAAALSADPDQVLVAVENELRWLFWSTGEQHPFVQVEAVGTENRLNDGRCDPAGRFFVGSMHIDPATNSSSGLGRGSLYRIDGAGEVDQLGSGFVVPNGLAFDHGRGRMYFADSPSRKILVWDYDVSTGIRLNERVFFEYADADGKPDGGCVDADGCYWSAAVHGWALIRITPEGQVDRRVEVPVERPTMPAFGGPDLSVLYVTSARKDGALARDDHPSQVKAGDTFAITGLGVHGVPEPIFASH